MMFRTCTIQVNLDFADEEDMIRKFRTSLALQPVATALFANSPFCDGKPSGQKSLRSKVWEDTDPDRTGTLSWVFEDGFGFDRYAEYVLDVPMYFVYRDGVYHDVTGESFRDFMEGKLPQFPGEYPTLDDWEQHLTTCFPEVRLKRYMEMRGADGGPWGNICALPALWVGLLYDEQALADAAALVADWTSEEREFLRSAVTKEGLQTPFRDGTVQDVAIEMVRISKEGLTRRGANEENFVDELMEMAVSGRSSADALLDDASTSGGWTSTGSTSSSPSETAMEGETRRWGVDAKRAERREETSRTRRARRRRLSRERRLVFAGAFDSSTSERYRALRVSRSRVFVGSHTAGSGGSGRASRTSAEISLKFGASADPSISKSAISLDASGLPRRFPVAETRRRDRSCAGWMCRRRARKPRILARRGRVRSGGRTRALRVP